MSLSDVVSLAQSGKTVLVVAGRVRLMRAFETVTEGPLELVSSIYRARGEERVLFETGGRVQFTSAEAVRGGGLRGLCADVVLTDDAALPDEWLEIELALAVVTGGELVVAPFGG